MLTETKARSTEELRQNIRAIEQCLSAFQTYTPVCFTDKPEEYSKYWPSAPASSFRGRDAETGNNVPHRRCGFPHRGPAEATAELQQLIARHGYEDACIYGHALEGNYHFILNQSFSSEAEVKRYEDLMNDVKTLVADKYDGSLKAEHGTGRNMAPFVRHEWEMQPMR